MGKSSINGLFSMAMLNNQRVKQVSKSLFHSTWSCPKIGMHPQIIQNETILVLKPKLLGSHILIRTPNKVLEPHQSDAQICAGCNPLAGA